MSGGDGRIRLVLADVDGTLVTSEKKLTDRAVAAVRELHEAGIRFAITSGRPPRGMQMLVEPLELQTPIAAFNGGLLVDPRMETLEEHTIPDDLVARAIELLGNAKLDVWVYRGSDWLIRDPDAPHVEREAHTVQFEPTVVDDFEGVTQVAKIVGVSDDLAAAAAAEKTAHDEIGDQVSAARSQPYYVDVTHPLANKGAVVKYLSGKYEITEDEIATIGDMPNDVLMFARSAISIAMGQSDREVQRAARQVTASNDDEGFAKAIERFVLRERS